MSTYGFTAMGYRAISSKSWAKPIGYQAYCADTETKELFLLLKGREKVITWGRVKLEDFDPKTIAQAEELLYGGLSLLEREKGFWFSTNEERLNQFLEEPCN